MKKLPYHILIFIFALLLAACGSSQQSASSSRTVKAVIKASALTADKNIAGINLTISVPAGVTPPFKADGSIDPSATVQITSSSPQNQTLPGASFTPATVTIPAQLAVSAIVAAGFSASDQITIHLNITEGTAPLAADFTLLSFEAFDTNGALVTGLNPTLTTTIQ
jgi:hypothetical protein